MTGRRLAWIRWSMTLFFAATTAACLIGLAVFTAHQDASARARVDARLLTQARQVALGLDIDDDGLVFSSQAPPGTNLNQALGMRAIGSSPAAVVVGDDVQYSSPSTSALPSARTIGRLTAAIRDGDAAVLTTTTSRSSDADGRWIAVPVHGSVHAVVLLGDLSVPPGEHRTVVLGLAAAVAGLVAAATFAGHLLSGLAMRPAVRATRQQEQFLREAAHELRTPLATISLITEAGLRDPATAADALRSVDQRLGRLNLLVGSLLARARADANGTEVERRPLRLDQLVEVTVDELRAGDRVEVVSAGCVVVGNADLIAQAIRNLVENALRHAPDSTVRVTVGDGAVTVQDDGRGADGDGVGRSAPRGTGTGLEIVEWVAHVHGADFGLDRSPLGGVRAALVFPERR
ncbi:MAG: HAMP domain-containing histidine kinase [Williamsia herbipolensis]|nr:HAMP domain-containing histidine kinase [Williamsia herbipolensis]